MAYVVVLSGEYMGQGDNDLGSTLIGSFLRNICLKSELPEKVVCYNAGVKLLEEGSFVIDAFQALEQKGVEILACGTCLKFFDIVDKIACGKASNMEEISNILIGNYKIVQP